MSVASELRRVSRQGRARYAATAVWIVAASSGLLSCKRHPDAPLIEVTPRPDPTFRQRNVVPPAATLSAASESSAQLNGVAENGSPIEQARAYEASGQVWMARLVLEQSALSPSGTKEEVETLARLCQAQSDAPCLNACSKKLGHPPKRGTKLSETRHGPSDAVDSRRSVREGRAQNGKSTRASAADR